MIIYHTPPENLLVHEGATIILYFIYALQSTGTILASVTVHNRSIYETSSQSLKRVKVFPVVGDLTVHIYGFSTKFIPRYQAYHPVEFQTNTSTDVKVIGLSQLIHFYCLQNFICWQTHSNTHLTVFVL